MSLHGKNINITSLIPVNVTWRLWLVMHANWGSVQIEILEILNVLLCLQTPTELAQPHLLDSDCFWRSNVNGWWHHKKWKEIQHKKHSQAVLSAYFLPVAIIEQDGNSLLWKVKSFPKSHWHILFQKQQGEKKLFSMKCPIKYAYSNFIMCSVTIYHSEMTINTVRNIAYTYLYVRYMLL